MVDVPEYIMEAARECCAGFFTGHRELYIEDVARAMAALSERERRTAQEVTVPPLPRYRYLKPREFLLFASYCGDDNDNCTPGRPCHDCLAMSNVYDENGKYLRQFAAPSLSTSAGGGE